MQFTRVRKRRVRQASLQHALPHRFLAVSNGVYRQGFSGIGIQQLNAVEFAFGNSNYLLPFVDSLYNYHQSQLLVSVGVNYVSARSRENLKSFEVYPLRRISLLKRLGRHLRVSRHITVDKEIDIFQLIVDTWSYRSIISNKLHRKILFHMICNNDGYQCIQGETRRYVKTY
ncbi:hypothetical protein D3C86_1124170 [compost metagenome]